MDLTEKIKDLENKIMAFRLVSGISQLTPEQANAANLLLDHLNSLRELTKTNINAETQENLNAKNDLDSISPMSEPSSVKEMYSQKPNAKRIVERNE